MLLNKCSTVKPRNSLITRDQPVLKANSDEVRNSSKSLKPASFRKHPNQTSYVRRPLDAFPCLCLFMSLCANLSLLPPHWEVSWPRPQIKPALLPTEWVPLTWGQSQPEDGLCYRPQGKVNEWAFLSNSGGTLKEIMDLVKVLIHMPLRSEWWFHIPFCHVALRRWERTLAFVSFWITSRGQTLLT